MFTVGCTGGIGSGKSTAANFFAELGAEVIDTDTVARQVVQPNSTALNAICQQFGPEIINSQGQLQRQKLRHIIFTDPQQKLWLEQLLHPLIWRETLRQAEQSHLPYCLLLVPLLIENNLHQEVNRVLLIECDETLQRQRLQQRDSQSDEAEINRIIAAQMNNQQRRQDADDILINNGDLSALEQQVAVLHQNYLTLNE